MKNECTDTIASTFGERLRLLRRKNEMSMDELGLALGVAKSTLSKYENGLMMPTLDSARKFADYFMVTVDWLSGGGPEEDALSSVPQPYIAVIRQAMEMNISPEKLKKIIEAVSYK